MNEELKKEVVVDKAMPRILSKYRTIQAKRNDISDVWELATLAERARCAKLIREAKLSLNTTDPELEETLQLIVSRFVKFLARVVEKG